MAPGWGWNGVAFGAPPGTLGGAVVVWNPGTAGGNPCPGGNCEGEVAGAEPPTLYGAD